MNTQQALASPSALGTSAGATTPARRRNGRLQACEPCRRRKVSCDHAAPVCKRCSARNNGDACVYLAAPRRWASSSNGRTPGTGRWVLRLYLGRSTRKPHLDEPVGQQVYRRERSSQKLTPRRNTRTPHDPTPDGEDPGPDVLSDPAGAGARNLPSETSPGYLGFTSFHQVYQETQNSLSLVQGASILSSMKSPQGPGSGAGIAHAGACASPKTLEMCVTVLGRIPGEEAAMSLFDKNPNPNDGWMRLASRRMTESLHAAFGRELRSRRPADLEAMAQLISQNTARPWSGHEPDAQKWIASFSGRNLRWECIGAMFTIWGLAALADHPHRPELRAPEGFDPRRIMLAYKEAAQLCIELCKGCAPTTLLLHLLCTNTIMESILVGDAALSFWRSWADVVALATYLGVHAIHVEDGTYVPTMAAEATRRLATKIFYLDKVAASFSGRPPLLGRKYMLTPPALDINEEALLAGGDALKKAVGALDGAGWNQHETFWPAKIIRARRLLAVVKDEIMEFALGNRTHASTEALLDLRTRAHNVVSELPRTMRYRVEDVRDLSIAGPALYAKVLVHLEHLQNLFFLARLLAQRNQNGPDDLLSVSFDMVSTTLIFWTHMDRLQGLHGDFEWLVMAYAAPAGGILSNELLNPTLHRAPVPGVTKSGIIQQLSLLVGFLDWVNPSAPNGELCSSCKAVIQHVLDQALNGPPLDPSNDAAEQGLDFNFDLGTDMGGFFNFDLLDTFDWLRPDMSSSQQSQTVG